VFAPQISPHFTADLISTELNGCEATQFALAATNHSSLERFCAAGYEWGGDAATSQITLGNAVLAFTAIMTAVRM